VAVPRVKPTLSLQLYVSGSAPNSLRAIANLRAICERHLADEYEIEIVDLMVQPERALANGILVTPTLVRRLPLPVRRLIGNLSADAVVLATLSSA
jgi:circadian clock protein KaiB